MSKDLKEFYEGLYQCEFEALQKLQSDLVYQNIMIQVNDILVFSVFDEKEVLKWCEEFRIKLNIPQYDFDNNYGRYHPKFKKFLSFTDVSYKKFLNKANRETIDCYKKLINYMTKFPNTKKMYKEVVFDE